MNIKKLLLFSIFIGIISVDSPSYTMCTESDPNIYNNPEAFFRVFELMHSYLFRSRVVQNANSYELLDVFITKRMP